MSGREATDILQRKESG
uniref:Uncharacterized protein n=1 Tax=Anguilla anguilla TaxID=7936 RepID=A0A0E9PT68_ANGAN